MLDKDGIDELVEELSQLAEKADNVLCATQLNVSPSIHVQGLKGGILEIRQALVDIVAEFDPDAEWNFGYKAPDQ